MSFDFIAAIKNIAPILAGTFGTPLAGLAVKALVSVIPDPATQASVTAAASSSGDSGALATLSDLFQQGVINTAQIKQAEMQHAKDMAELGYKNAADLAKIAADDRASARAMQVQVKSYIPGALAGTVTLGFFAILVLMMTGIYKPSDNNALLILLGALSTSFGGIIQYYFGSSAGSASKDATLADIAKAS